MRCGAGSDFPRLGPLPRTPCRHERLRAGAPPCQPLRGGRSGRWSARHACTGCLRLAVRWSVEVLRVGEELPTWRGCCADQGRQRREEKWAYLRKWWPRPRKTCSGRLRIRRAVGGARRCVIAGCRHRMPLSEMCRRRVPSWGMGGLATPRETNAADMPKELVAYRPHASAEELRENSVDGLDTEYGRSVRRGIRIMTDLKRMGRLNGRKRRARVSGNGWLATAWAHRGIEGDEMGLRGL